MKSCSEETISHKWIVFHEVAGGGFGGGLEYDDGRTPAVCAQSGQEHLPVPGGLPEWFVMLGRDAVVVVSPSVGIGGQLGAVAGTELIEELHQSIRSTSQSVTGLSFLKWLMTKVGKALVVNWGG